MRPGFTMRGGPLKLVVTAGGVIMAGIFTLSFATSVSMQTLQAIVEARKRKTAPRCRICQGKGLVVCKLCKEKATIDWTPLYDPVIIKPCVCPTCDGNRLQRCLNCAGRGYIL